MATRLRCRTRHLKLPERIVLPVFMAVSGILVAKRSVGEMAYERMGVSDALTFSKGWYSVRDGSCLTVQYYIRGMSG